MPMNRLEHRLSKVTDQFQSRHIAPSLADVTAMLEEIGVDSLDALIRQVVPDNIRDTTPLAIDTAVSERDALEELRAIGAKNTRLKSMIGQGYYGTFTPPVIQRNVLENPAWYTAYTPYQPEISQGRLEVLFNFQTLVCELTGMPIANASMLDEATAAAEAMTMSHRIMRGKRGRILVSTHCHPQTLDVVTTRAAPLSIEVIPVDEDNAIEFGVDDFALLLQCPDTKGVLRDYKDLIANAHAAGLLVIMVTDLLALTLVKPPGEIGADIVVGSAQRFGVPIGFGGPHAAFFATTEKHKRSMPGRLVGLSIDNHGNPAYRLALQTREQHIRREKATSNICTAQALLAIIATFYASYHGPLGLRKIALRIHMLTSLVCDALKAAGFTVNSTNFFDTLTVTSTGQARAWLKKAESAGLNLRYHDDDTVGISLDETCDVQDVQRLLTVFEIRFDTDSTALEGDVEPAPVLAPELQRQSEYLSQAVFHHYQSETQMMRYMQALADRDIALNRAMIPLGSCTMKLNAAAEMAAVSWPEFSEIHPFSPAHQTKGYARLISDIEQMLCACTGYDAVSVQPNAGSQGEYAGLLAIKRYHESRGDVHRNVCLIPQSAHGTNPASAQMCGLQVVVVSCDDSGNIDLQDLDLKIATYGDSIAAIMITYPSTHGVFEAQVSKVCEKVHEAGGQVYIDGANLNAMVGVASPGKFGGDVSHLNLHKTFCIPHGGGGPGVGPVGVRSHLAPFLPGHRITGDANGAVSAAPWGSALILTITWMYIRMMGPEGLRQATQHAILGANYIASKLSKHYEVLYTGENGYVAHECILDTRALKDKGGVTVDDIAKRLIDYGFHAPTMSFPVAGTLMIEPTESEPLRELDRFCDAMTGIYQEYQEVVSGRFPADDNPLGNAPHTALAVMDDVWDHPYSRKQAAFPAAVAADSNKYWSPVGRVDNAHGDKNLICSCPPMQAFMEEDT